MNVPHFALRGTVSYTVEARCAFDVVLAEHHYSIDKQKVGSSVLIWPVVPHRFHRSWSPIIAFWRSDGFIWGSLLKYKSEREITCM
jgi:hypothetical protein